MLRCWRPCLVWWCCRLGLNAENLKTIHCYDYLPASCPSRLLARNVGPRRDVPVDGCRAVCSYTRKSVVTWLPSQVPCCSCLTIARAEGNQESASQTLHLKPSQQVQNQPASLDRFLPRLEALTAISTLQNCQPPRTPLTTNLFDLFATPC